MYAKHFDVSTKQTIYIVLICVAVEQKRTHVKYQNAHDLNNYFHVDSDISLAVSTRMHYCPILTSDGSKIGLFYLVACERSIRL